MHESSYSPKEILLEMLDQGLVMMHIDARHPDVLVPSYLKQDPHLRLNLSYMFQLPDLEIDDEGVSTTLSFQRKPFFCQIPYTALWGLSQEPHHELQLFPEALPTELLDAVLQPKPEPPSPSRTNLQLVVDNAAPALEEDAPTAHPKPKLTLVKK